MYFIFAIIAFWVTFVVIRKVLRGLRAVATGSREFVGTAKASMADGLVNAKTKAEEKGSNFIAGLANSAAAAVNKIDPDKVGGQVDKATAQAAKAKAKADDAAKVAKAAAKVAAAEAKEAWRDMRSRASAAMKPNDPEVEQF